MEENFINFLNQNSFKLIKTKIFIDKKNIKFETCDFGIELSNPISNNISYDIELYNYVKTEGKVLCHKNNNVNYYKIDHYVYIENNDDIVNAYKYIRDTNKIFDISLFQSKPKYIIDDDEVIYGKNKFVEKIENSIIGYLNITDEYVYIDKITHISLISDSIKNFEKYKNSIFICQIYGKTLYIFDCIKLRGIDITNLNHDVRMSDVILIRGKIFEVYKCKIFIDNITNIDPNKNYHFKNKLLNIIHHDKIELFKYVTANIINHELCHIYTDENIEDKGQKNSEVLICYLKKLDSKFEAKKIYDIGLEYNNYEFYDYVDTFGIGKFMITLYEPKHINPKYNENDDPILSSNNEYLIKCSDVYDCMLKACCNLYQKNTNLLYRNSIKEKFKKIYKLIGFNLVINDEFFLNTNSDKTIIIKKDSDIFYLVAKKNEKLYRVYF
jgi:hypothetical protein